MLNITEIAEELQEITAWQETPEILSSNDYVKIVVRAVKKFFVDINRPEEYDMTLWTTDENENTCYDRVFLLDEEEYIRILCKIEFFKRVQTDVNNSFGYSTDALTVTNADKPYANLKNTIDDLEHERRIVFNKMVRYTLGES
jgi:hypothetical protein